MSHIADVKMVVSNIGVLAQACREVGLKFGFNRASPRERTAKMKKRQTTVTTPGWYVSVTTSSAAKGARLSVFRGWWMGRERYGDAHNRWFPTADAAWAFALEHGYIQVYRKGWCPLHRRQHWFCGARTYGCATSAGHPYDGCDEAQASFDRIGESADERAKRASLAMAVNARYQRNEVMR